MRSSHFLANIATAGLLLSSFPACASSTLPARKADAVAACATSSIMAQAERQALLNLIVSGADTDVPLDLLAKVACQTSFGRNKKHLTANQLAQAAAKIFPRIIADFVEAQRPFDPNTNDHMERDPYDYMRLRLNPPAFRT